MLKIMGKKLSRLRFIAKQELPSNLSSRAFCYRGLQSAPTKWKIAKADMNRETQETVLYWTEVSVRWAKQWLQSETGEKKKEEVLQFVSGKLNDLKINLSADDLDKIIESVYEQVKKEKEWP